LKVAPTAFRKPSLYGFRMARRTIHLLDSTGKKTAKTFGRKATRRKSHPRPFTPKPAKGLSGKGERNGAGARGAVLCAAERHLLIGRVRFTNLR